MFRQLFTKMVRYLLGLLMRWLGVQPSNESADQNNRSERTETLQRVSDRFENYPEHVQQLIPGILDDITLNHITPKLQWKTLLNLSLVSRVWKRHIRSRQVYNARVRSHSTETLVLINNFRSEGGRYASIGLYSPSDGSFCQIPGIPHVELGIPMSSQCISLDGKIYVLGGLHDGTFGSTSNKVYVMDLAGQWKWEQCASMKYARRKFGCGVLHGKIYVCGGFSAFDGVGPEGLGPAVWEPEVYDPNLDAWFPIKSMTSVRANDHVTAWGDELLLFKGDMFNPSFFDGTRSRASLDYEDGRFESTIYVLEHYVFEAYSPVKNEWRSVNPYALGYGHEDGGESVFVADGKFHAMNRHKLYVYDFDRNLGTHRHSFSFEAIENEFRSFEAEVTLFVNNQLSTFMRRQHLESFDTVLVNNELVSLVNSLSYIGGLAGPHLVRSTGFGGEEESITWERAECPFQMSFQPLLCALQL